MLAASIGSVAAAVAAACFAQTSSASPLPYDHKYAELERRYPHLNYTRPSDDLDVFTYAGGHWYHEYNQSFSNDLSAYYTFNTGAGAIEYQIWAGKKNDRGLFTVLFDGEEVGTGDAYSESETGTEAVMLFNQTGLDTNNHLITVKNHKDDRVPNGVPYLDLDYVYFRT